MLLAPDVVTMVMYAPEQWKRAVKAWEYIAWGFGTAGLAVLVGLLGWALSGRLADLPIPLWLAFEGMQRGACRLGFPIGNVPPPDVEVFSGLCGRFFYSLCLLAFAVFAVWIANKGDKDG